MACAGKTLIFYDLFRLLHVNLSSLSGFPCMNEKKMLKCCNIKCEYHLETIAHEITTNYKTLELEN